MGKAGQRALASGKGGRKGCSVVEAWECQGLMVPPGFHSVYSTVYNSSGQDILVASWFLVGVSESWLHTCGRYCGMEYRSSLLLLVVLAEISAR